MIFYLGTHETSWLSRLSVPLFISDRRLRLRRSLPVAVGPWALDSGGFTELSTHGSWDYGPTPQQYASRVQVYQEEIGHLDWVAPQDWMCEPWITAKTGLTVTEHQARTVGNLIDLRSIDPSLPIIPVLQGWRLAEYTDCINRYERSGILLGKEPLVGLGSVCRRQATGEIAELVAHISNLGLNLHGFGVKTSGLSTYGYYLVSADSMAWSYRARKNPPLPGHTHQSCSNCAPFALDWRNGVLDKFHRTPFQPSLFDIPRVAS